MVEFKAAADGRMFLLEINPRLWGSLQLAIDSGRDFPRLLAGLAACESTEDSVHFDEDCARLPAYKVGRRLRWTLGTLDHALIRLRTEGLHAASDIGMRNSLRFFQRLGSTSAETWRWDDIRPFFSEVGNWLTDLKK
jgi:hypothetical protein